MINGVNTTIGVHHNLDRALFEDSGWVAAYEAPYSDPTGALDVDMTVMYAPQTCVLVCGGVVGSPSLQLCAFATAGTLIEATPGDNTKNILGAEWYHKLGWAIGFAPGGETVHLFLADRKDGESRLSWHTGGASGGYRNGNDFGLNNDDTRYKLVLVAPAGHDYCSTCENGFKHSADSTLTHPRCEDVDECATGVASCPDGAICKNTPGNFDCQCPDRWALEGDKCVPVDTGGSTSGDGSGDGSATGSGSGSATGSGSGSATGSGSGSATGSGSGSATGSGSGSDDRADDASGSAASGADGSAGTGLQFCNPGDRQGCFQHGTCLAGSGGNVCVCDDGYSGARCGTALEPGACNPETLAKSDAERSLAQTEVSVTGVRDESFEFRMKSPCGTGCVHATLLVREPSATGYTYVDAGVGPLASSPEGAITTMAFGDIRNGGGRSMLRVLVNVLCTDSASSRSFPFTLRLGATSSVTVAGGAASGEAGVGTAPKLTMQVCPVGADGTVDRDSCGAHRVRDNTEVGLVVSRTAAPAVSYGVIARCQLVPFSNPDGVAPTRVTVLSRDPLSLTAWAALAFCGAHDGRCVLTCGVEQLRFADEVRRLRGGRSMAISGPNYPAETTEPVTLQFPVPTPAGVEEDDPGLTLDGDRASSVEGGAEANGHTGGWAAGHTVAVIVAGAAAVVLVAAVAMGAYAWGRCRASSRLNSAPRQGRPQDAPSTRE